MGISTAPGAMTSEEIAALSKEHTFFSWSVQGAVDPIAVDHAEGIYLYTPEGRRIIDFNSQLMSVNIGHGDRRVISAITEQATKLQYVQPAFATEIRARLGAKLAEILPGDMDKVFFTLGGAEAVENAIKLARAATGRHKILARYRAYHGATLGAMTLTGDPRRWANDAVGQSTGGAVHFFGPHLYRSHFHATTEAEECERALLHLEQTIQYEGPATVAAVILETIVGTAGVLMPPPGYLAGVRALCDKYGIVYIADEVMAGFARSGAWFAIDHWGVTPDLIAFAKGSNSGYVPVGGVIISEKIRDTFKDRVYPGGLTYSGHPLACASIVATINAMKEEGVIEHAARLGEEVFGPALREIAEKHPSVGEVRGVGAFWALDLVRSKETREMLVPYNAAGADAAPMNELGAAMKARGVWPFINFNRLHVVPPCTISEEDARKGLAALDEALDVVDVYAS